MRVLVASLTLMALAATLTLAAAQETESDVLHEGSALPWSGEPGGVRTAPLYGSSRTEGSFTFRLQVPDGFEMAPHTHPVAEHMTVLSGRFFVGIGEVVDRGSAVEYGPGSYLVTAAGTPAYMWAEGTTVVQVHGDGPLTTDFVTAPEPDARPVTETRDHHR